MKWPTVRLEEICFTTSGGTPSRSKPEYYFGDIPWVKSGDLNDGVISSTPEFISDSGLKDSSAKLFKKGTILIAMYGATVGKIAILGIDAASNQAVCGITASEKLDNMFLFYYL